MMKMDMEVKAPESDSYKGNFTQEDMDCQLEHYIAAKKIENDPVMFARLKDYAMSKNKMIEGYFKEEAGEAESEKPQSLDDLKKLKKKKQQEMMEEEDA